MTLLTDRPPGTTGQTRRKVLLTSGVVAAVLFLFGFGFVVGELRGRGEYVNENGHEFTGRIVGYSPGKSICVVQQGDSSGSCGIPLVDDPASVRLGDEVHVVVIDIREAGEHVEGYYVTHAK